MEKVLKSHGIKLSLVGVALVLAGVILSLVYDPVAILLIAIGGALVLAGYFWTLADIRKERQQSSVNQ